MQIKSSKKESQCKICNNTASLFGVTDFNTSCYADNVHRYNYPLSGHAIYYFKCRCCGLIYTDSFDNWSEADFKKHIYNDEYIKYDPNFNEKRPQHNAKLLLNSFSDIHNYHALDFGCGDGQLVAILRNNDVDITGWDPFNYNGEMPSGTFEFITSFEVMEHTPSPYVTVEQINSLLNKHNGKYFFSTEVNDSKVGDIMNNWYIAPRNGHVTIYSKSSLDILFSAFNMKVLHFSDLYHLAYKC